MQTITSSAGRIALLLSLLLIVVLAPPAAHSAGEAETVVFRVRGLWAEICETLVEEALLLEFDDIESVEADHEADTITIVFDARRLTVESLAASIDDCPLMRVTGSETHELDRDEIRRQRRCWCCVGQPSPRRDSR